MSFDQVAFNQVFDTASAHIFESWTDKDLYRAIDAPEHPEPGEAHDNEIAEYVAELQKRVVERARLAARSAEIRRQYGITFDASPE